MSPGALPGRLPRAGEPCRRLELEDAWLVDPVAGREGRAALVVADGRIAAVRWARGHAAAGEPATLVLPGFVDLHAHLREPGNEDAESVASGLAAAAHGGFTTVCALADTTPPLDGAAALAGLALAARASRSPVRLLAWGAATAGRAGRTLAAMGELADAGAIGFSDDPAPIAGGAILRHVLAYAGALGRPVAVDAREPSLTAGTEMREGLVATVLGLRGWPVAGEVAAVALALAVLHDVARAAPRGAAPRLHLAHVSSADSLALVRQAREAGLAVSCDVTPHHLALHDGWVAGDRRFAWQVGEAAWPAAPAEASPYDPRTRAEPPLGSPADAAALAAALRDGTVAALATDHSPQREVDSHVEYGDAAPGLSGLETALGLVLVAVEAGVLDLATAVRALTVGPAQVLGPLGRGLVPGFAAGAVADLVVVDRAADWAVTPASLHSRGHNTPLLGRRLPGRVLATVAGGRFAYLDPELATAD